jgi:hypothetical protein
MTTKYQRPSAAYEGQISLANRDKYQTDASAQPKIAISSQKMDGDFNYLIDALNTVDEASGSAGSIAARLSQSLNDDGTLKASVSSVLDDWIRHEVTGLNRVDDTTLTFDGDGTGIYLPNRRVRLIVSGIPLFAHVASTALNSAITTLNLVDVTDSEGMVQIIGNTPSEISYSPSLTGYTGNNNYRFKSLLSDVFKLQAEEGLFVLEDTSVSGETYALRSKNGVLEILQNTGTASVPIWTLRTSIDENGFAIPSGTVDTLHLADKSVSTGKISSDLAIEGQIMKADGLGGVSYHDLAIPAWEVVSTSEITTPVSEVTFTTNLIANTMHKFIFESVAGDSGSRNIEVQFKSTSSAQNVGYAQNAFTDAGAESFIGSGSLSQARLTNGVSNGLSGELLLSTADQTNDNFSGYWVISGSSSTSTGCILNTGGFYSTAKNITLDEVRIYPTLGTLDNGRIHHLKLKV